MGTRRTLASCERGVAAAEGLIALVPLVLAFSLLVYVSQLYAQRLEAKSRARSCSWSYASSGCQASLLPPACKGPGIERRAAHSGGERARGELRQGLVDGLAMVGSVSRALLGLDEGEELVATRQVERPTPFGGGSTTLTQGHHLLCNERSRDPLELAFDAICELSNGAMPACP